MVYHFISGARRELDVDRGAFHVSRQIQLLVAAARNDALDILLTYINLYRPVVGRDAAFGLMCVCVFAWA